MTPVCSVVIATLNRCVSLRAALECVLDQSLDAPYEVIVVNNGSTDATAAVVAELQRRHPRLRYAFEPTPGPAAARNKGVSLSSGELILFTDDDIRPTHTWAATMNEAAAAHPEVTCFGGRILPSWGAPLPAWLGRENWTGALALQDYGDAPVGIGPERPLSLATANMAVRRCAFDALGGFDQEYRYAEDTELLVRLWRSGRQSLYVPDAVVVSQVPPERMKKAYHRRWHIRNARWSARMRLDESFDGAGRLLPGPLESATLLGVPGYLYRQLIATFMRWAGAASTFQRSKAFHFEKQLWQQSFYLWTRMRNPEARRYRLSAEIGQLSRSFGRKPGRRPISHP